MARWDDEQIKVEVPPKDIQCETCIYKLKPVKLGGEVVDRAGYDTCAKYVAKPVGVLWNKQPCAEYVEEE